MAGLHAARDRRTHYQSCYTNSNFVDRRRNSGLSLWLAHAGKCPKANVGMGIKMKTFISIVTAGCFIVSAFAGAAIHTLFELESQYRGYGVISASLSPREITKLSLRELSEVRT
jgi:hypothetical protein